MAEEFEGDLRGAVVWGADLRDARLRDVDLRGVRVHHGLFDDVELDGFVDGLVVNGVDVTSYVREHDPWEPLRGLLRPRTADEVRASVAASRAAWDGTIAEVRRRDPADRTRRVAGEWSFVETLRHLVFATDKWVVHPFTGAAFTPLGMPNTGSVDEPWPGLDRDATPTEDEVLVARAAQAATLDALLAELDDGALSDEVEVLENGTVRRLDCWHVVLEEEFEHRRYALRDLAAIDAERARVAT